MSGFDLWAVVAEYRLRASVLRFWRESEPAPDLRDLDDLTRFNESMDQSLTYAVRSYAERAERERAGLLANEQASRQEAQAANRAKDVFLATFSQMRTPLNAIVGWLSILRHESAEPRHFQRGLRSSSATPWRKCNSSMSRNDELPALEAAHLEPDEP